MNVPVKLVITFSYFCAIHRFVLGWKSVFYDSYGSSPEIRERMVLCHFIGGD